MSGNERAYRQVFDAYYRELVISSYQILKDENICKDAVQEVFLELWKNRKKLHQGIILLPYLKRSVINRSLNILKSRKHHMSSGPEPLEVLKDRNRQPDEIAEENEFNSVVMRAINKMPDRCRAIYMLSRTEGLPHREIARQLDVSTKTIENQMTKALKILRKEITHYRVELLGLMLISGLDKWGIFCFGLLSSKLNL